MEYKDYNTKVDSSKANQENQEIKNGNWGGPREGAGRPRGESDNSILRRKLRDYISSDELDLFVESLKSKAMEDSKVMMYLIDHIFGKARQNLGLDGGEEGKALIIQVAEAIKDKNKLDDSSQSSK
jgi:hypothetical protein